VHCESCHGPGSAFKKKSIMEDINKAMASGLIKPTEETCKQCHNKKCSSFQGFKYSEYVKKIDHRYTKLFDNVPNQNLFNLVYALSGKWWLSRHGNKYLIEITAKKGGSDFTSKYLEINTPSTFSGQVWFDSEKTANIKFTQYDSRTKFTATHTGKRVNNDRFEGVFSDNRGRHGVSFALWR